MSVSLKKRNLRVLSVTALLLLLVFFVVQNANSISFGEEELKAATFVNPVASGLTSAGTAVHNNDEIVVDKESGKKGKDQESALVDAEIDKIKQEVNSGSGASKDNSISQKAGSGSKDGTVSEGEFDPAKEYSMILGISPVIVFSKSFCPYSSRLKELLTKEYTITPSYVVIELDKHKHGVALQKFIEKKTGRATVPNLMINGKSRGGFDDIKALHSKGELLGSLNKWGDGDFTVKQLEKPSNN